MSRYEKSFLESLNAQVHLPSYIGKHVPTLKKESADTYKSVCPFHKEETGSFTVSESKRFYHCFGCGAHGDAIAFAMEHLKLKFHDAVKDVADFAGVMLPQEASPERTSEEKKDAARYAKACDALLQAQSIYSKLLAETVAAQTYLRERGVTQDSIDNFGLGFAPKEWGTITRHKTLRFNKEALEDSGLSTKKDGEKGANIYDRFRERIMFPIYGRTGRLIGFGGRAISKDHDPKYLNSPECMVFKKGANLYGLKQASDEIFKTKRVFVVEGYMDVVMTSQYGVKNVVASLGTSVTNEQMKYLFSLAERITFCFDGDSPGVKAAWRAANNILPHVDEKHKVDFMMLPAGFDPDDLVRSEGKEGFERIAASSRTLTDYILDVFTKYTDFNNGESLAKYLFKSNEMADQISHPVMKLSFQKRIAELAGISLDTMLLMLKEQRENSSSNSPSTIPVPQTVIPAVAPALSPSVVAKPVEIVEISVAAKLLGIALLKDRTIAMKLEPDYLSRFLSTSDRDMLLPLLAYLRANGNITEESMLATMAFNPHIGLIRSLSISASLVGDKFDAQVEAKAVIDGFRKIERVWQIVNSAKAEAKNIHLVQAA